MRLFIASKVTLEAYAKIKEDFSHQFEGRWSKEENLHLTWRFLGERSDAEAVFKQLALIAPLQKRVPLVGLGSFTKVPKILFAAPKDSKTLYRKSLEFTKSGFEDTKFIPHVTLCRIKKIRQKELFLTNYQAYNNRFLGYIEPEIFLYQSQLTPNGPIYRKLSLAL